MISFNCYLIFIICWIIVGIGTGLFLLQKEAPYGRFSSNNWGPVMSNRLGWLLMEATVMVAFTAWIPVEHYNWGTPASIMIGLFFIHYVHRSFVYPLMIRTKGKKMPVIIMLSAMLFNTVNGSLLGIWFADFAHYPDSWYYSPLFIAGVLLFLSGMLINWQADYTLISLRAKGESGYKIPRSGLFNLISSPNLFGEIIEWGGFAMLTWSLPAIAFFIWTCANLIPRAITNHRWYRKEFPHYPATRKILLPYLW
jgi:protein-S-isoprenylcysteine O-methyltransferase Ste14